MADLTDTFRALRTGFRSQQEWDAALARLAELEQAAHGAAHHIVHGDFTWMPEPMTPWDMRRTLGNRLLLPCGMEPIPPPKDPLAGRREDHGTEPDA